MTPSRLQSPVGPPIKPYGKQPGGLFSYPIMLFLEYRHTRLLRLLAVVSAALFFGGMWSFYSRSPEWQTQSIAPPNNGGGTSGGSVGYNLHGTGKDTKSKFDHGKNPPKNVFAFDAEYHPPSPPEFGVPEGAEDVVLVIKTGGNVLWQRFPVHAITTLKRVPHFLVFSDLEDKVGDIIIHDSLKDVDPKIRNEHDQFRIYRTMHGLQAPPPELQLFNAMNSSSPSELKSYTLQGEGLPGSRPGNLDIGKLDLKGGWDLDKYKNVPILYQTFRAYPNKKWYVFIDADTAVFWTGLVRYLTKELDYKKPYYLGAPTVLGKELFAHGGTGYVLSYEAARIAVEDHPELEHAYEEYAITDCCGDHILGRVMEKVGVDLKGERPRVNGEAWYALQWDDSTWCERIWTFHHVNQRDIQELWEFERYMHTTVMPNSDRKDVGKTDILYADLYHYFAKPHLTSLEAAWNNLSNDMWLERPDYNVGNQSPAPSAEELKNMKDVGKKKKWEEFLKLNEKQRAAVESHENCARACEDWKECVQWKWVKGKCIMHKGLIFGKKDPNPKGEKEAWWSGWALERIEDLRKKQWCEKDRGGGFPAEEKGRKE